MSPNKTLYVRDDDLGIWEWAERYAQTTRQSVSTLVAAALRLYLPAEGMHEIRLDVGEPALTKAFTGRWLVEPDITETRLGGKYGDAECPFTGVSS